MVLRPAFALALAAILALTASSLAVRPLGGAPAQPRMVQPEALDQGFILLVTDRSGTANAESPIHLASNHNGWNPNDPTQRLTQRSDGKWQIVLPKPSLDSRMAFKFARGSWETAETDPDYKDIENRSLPMVDVSALAPGERPVIELVVHTFADQRPWTPARAALDPYRPIDATGTIKRVEVVGGDDGSLVRDVLVWLPPGYDDPANADRRYPVLYLHDGQNVFEQLPGVPGEWRADETATRLIEEDRIEPLIIVGIPHAGAGRMSEYLPIAVFDGVAPRGDRHADFLAHAVVPRVERAFRVSDSPEDRAVGGSSLGAIIALHTAQRHPDLFGKVLFESPTLLPQGAALMKHFADSGVSPGRIFIGMGGSEAGPGPANATLNARYAQAARDFDAMLETAGVDDARRRLVIAPGAVHNEEAWAARLPAALEFLFPASE